jgi:phosphatidylinositol dimannoside acyltransferase
MSPDRPSPDPESLRERVAYHAYAFMERVAMSAPERAGRGVFAALGSVAHRVAPGVRGTVAANLARVVGQPPDSDLVRAATREAFDLYARYWYETFRARALSPEELLKRFRLAGLENVDRALEAGLGAILPLPHMGNWDVAGQFVAQSGYRLISVAEDLRPRRLADLFLRHREALGMEILMLEGRGTSIRLAQLLAENAVVALVADRNLAARGVEVEMFGAARSMPAGPALLSLSTGAPMLPSYVWTTEDGWFCRIGEPLEIERTGVMREDVTALTRLLASEFERCIAARPTDWHMFQPAWPDGRPSQRIRPAPG